jgi:hypothetical protein
MIPDPGSGTFFLGEKKQKQWRNPEKDFEEKMKDYRYISQRNGSDPGSGKVSSRIRNTASCKWHKCKKMIIFFFFLLRRMKNSPASGMMPFRRRARANSRNSAAANRSPTAGIGTVS